MDKTTHYMKQVAISQSPQLCKDINKDTKQTIPIQQNEQHQQDKPIVDPIEQMTG